MKSRPASFDSLTRCYRALEFLAFGRDLERARFCLLDRLVHCHEILVLGEGDGRCLARLVKVAPTACIHCIDASAAMLARAEVRIAGSEAHRRVTFECADIFAASLPPAHFDAVVTCFFLDCFTADQTAAIVGRVSSSLRPTAQWLFADFSVPAHGLARKRAQAWLAILYTFFRLQTRLQAHVLPPSEDLIQHAGFQPLETRSFQLGLLRTVLFARPALPEPAENVPLGFAPV